jgi:hypothetical protein
LNSFRLISLCLLFFVAVSCEGQSAPSIRFKKDRSGLVFFQKGAKSDTISRGNLFFLLVPDSTKEFILISVENGRMEATSNDSLVTVVHFPGINYESRYVVKGKAAEGDPGKPALVPAINGASSLDRNLVRIRIIHKMKGEQLVNSYYFK